MAENNILIRIFGAGLSLVIFTSAVFAVDDPIFFPKGGQSHQAQAEDKGACNTWAQAQSQIDPNYLKEQIKHLNEQAVLSSINLRGPEKSAEQQQKNFQRATYGRDQLEQEADKFMRAFSACMDAKGYSVK